MNIFMTSICVTLRYFKYNNNYLTNSVLVNEIAVVFFFTCLKGFFFLLGSSALGSFDRRLGRFFGQIYC